MAETYAPEYEQVWEAAARPFGCGCLATDCPMCGSVDMALLNALPMVVTLLKARAEDMAGRSRDYGRGLADAAAWVQSWTAEPRGAS